MKLANILSKNIGITYNIPTWIKKGDRIKCILQGSGVYKDKIYTVESINSYANIILFEFKTKFCGHFPFRFQKVNN